MSKKIILGALLLMAGMSMQAQVYDYTNADTTETTSLADIIKQQSGVQTKYKDLEHISKVWKHGGYFNMAYNTSTITAIDDIPMYSNTLGEYQDSKPEFKTDWGVSLIWGHGYRLHKKAIANIVGINIDYTWMDLNVNHFKAEEGTSLYNSSLKTAAGCYYTPYALEKYQASYGMNIGPSLTLAPFTPIGVKELDFVKIQAYYHWGYRISAIYMANNDKMDANTGNDADYQEMKSNIKLSYGHNMYTTYGINISWRAVGLGYEHSTGKIKYKPSNKDNYGKDQIEMDQKTDKIYINFRF